MPHSTPLSWFHVYRSLAAVHRLHPGTPAVDTLTLQKTRLETSETRVKTPHEFLGALQPCYRKEQKREQCFKGNISILYTRFLTLW